MKKFLLVGGYSHANPGDEAILKATIYRLNELFPDAYFYVWACRRAFKIQFDRPIAHEVIRWSAFEAFQSGNFLSRLGLKIYTDLYPLSGALLRTLSVPPQFRNALQESAAVVFVGGGYLNSSYLVAEMEYLCRLARKSGKPVYLFGQTLGPFTNKKHSDMARAIFSSAEAIVIRDRHSAEEASKWAGKTFVGVDDAVGFAPFLDAEDRAAIDEPLGPAEPGTVKIGLNLRAWNNSREHYGEIAEVISEFIASIDAPARIVFLPMETSLFCDDRKEAVEFAKHLPKNVDFRVLNREVSAEAKLRLAGGMDLFVGMRLHSLDFALTSGVPTVGLYHDEYYYRKIGGIFEAFGVPDFALPLNEVKNKLRFYLEKAYTEAKPISELLRRRQHDIVGEKRALVAKLLGAPPPAGPFDAATAGDPAYFKTFATVPMKG